jgi:hypothetical protein
MALPFPALRYPLLLLFSNFLSDSASKNPEALSACAQQRPDQPDRTQQDSASGFPVFKTGQRRLPTMRFCQKKWSVSAETQTAQQPLFTHAVIGKPLFWFNNIFKIIFLQEKGEARAVLFSG